MELINVCLKLTFADFDLIKTSWNVRLPKDFQCLVEGEKLYEELKKTNLHIYSHHFRQSSHYFHHKF